MSGRSRRAPAVPTFRRDNSGDGPGAANDQLNGFRWDVDTYMRFMMSREQQSAVAGRRSHGSSSARDRSSTVSYPFCARTTQRHPRGHQDGYVENPDS
jgi:hypothetical protein